MNLFILRVYKTDFLHFSFFDSIYSQELLPSENCQRRWYTEFFNGLYWISYLILISLVQLNHYSI